MNQVNQLKEMLVRHEGLRLKPYHDTVGKLTIGVGRNLDDFGLTNEEVLVLLHNDILRTMQEVRRAFPWYLRLNAVRQNVVLNMVFNLGLSRFLGFKKTIEALEGKNWDTAAKEMLDSKWAMQVGRRAQELSKMMKTGKD